MKLEFKVAQSEHKDFIFNECINLVYKYENLQVFDINEIIKFERLKVETEIDKYTAVYDNNIFIGVFKLTKESEYYELDDFYIVEEQRNKGYGTIILQECIKNTPITLYVFKNNKIAFDLYVRHGFEILEDLKDRARMIKRK